LDQEASEDVMADRMWSDDQYDYVELDGNVIMFERVDDKVEEWSAEEQIKMLVVESLLWGFLFVAVLFVCYVIWAAL
jgi:hypothetical protein